MDHISIHTLAASAGSDDPIEALQAIASLRKELDRAEAVAARRAHNAGASWQLVAFALGISRQAVHKKYGRSSAPSRKHS
jgi:DNA invertase Pin-like site-specific DNA recombinase